MESSQHNEIDTKSPSKESGSYTANLIGNIRSHLAGLQGYDVMALELIQNADDAKAEEIIFDITDEGLLVTNSGQFTYCGDLHTRPCGFIANNNYSCDYHRIADVGSGGKLSRSENIGRFGIGFVSTYQITDHPEIRSAGIKLTLRPEEGQWFIEPFEQTEGTSFFLSWAIDPNAEARRALGLSHISLGHIDQLTDDFQTVLRKSLLFLRHVRKAEVRRNGQLLLACDLDRGKGSDLILSFRPSGEVEQWHILRADAAEAASILYESHPRLENLGRGTKISIGLRIDPDPLTEGRLYAFLPTEQPTGLPLHINADFFPEADRKALIFSGHQHEQAWNEMLIDAAAAELAREPEALMEMLGYNQLWQIFNRAFDLSKSEDHPACFSKFWERIKVTGAQSSIAPAQDGTTQPPCGVLFSRNQLNNSQVKALEELGGRVVIDDLRPYQNALTQLGTPILTLERLTNLMSTAFENIEAGIEKVSELRVENFYRHLWSIVNDLLPETSGHKSTSNPSIHTLLSIPFIVTEALYLVTINQSYRAQSPLQASKAATLLPRLAILSRHLLEYHRISHLVSSLDLEVVSSHLQSEIDSPEFATEVISADKAVLRDLYSLLAELDSLGNIDNDVYITLKSLPIWLSSKGLIKADQALLPGNFNDPTGQADLLDPSALTESAREFVSNKIGVKSQTIEAFVQTVLPGFFDEDGPIDPSKYQRLLTELADHPSLINDSEIRGLLGSLPLIPTQDGNWSTPGNTYWRTEALVKVLGDDTHLWLDPTRIPNSRSVLIFIDGLGILQLPHARHLVDRMLYIAKKYLPTDDSKRASGEAFYVLCDNFDEWKDKMSFKDIIAELKDVECFPAYGDYEQWYSSVDLYAPFRADAFKSQAHIIDFRNTARLKTELLEYLGVSINPETQLVINHLLYCVDGGIQPHITTYQVLNERAQRNDPLIAQLQSSRCIYVDSQKSFVRPHQLYWTAQQLGRYAFTIPGNLELLKPLFTAIGVKNSPDANDFVDLLLDIVGEYFEQGKSIEGADRSVYEACLNGISTAVDIDALTGDVLNRLKDSPSVLNLLGKPTYPDELLLQDSEWHTAFFNGELNQALCKPAPEQWPLLKQIGVRRLSDCAEVELEFVDGEKKPEMVISDKLRERAEIVTRLLHDKSTSIRKKVDNAFETLTTFSYDVVRIQTIVNLGENQVNAPPSSVQAYFDINQNSLILARPIGDRCWAHVFNALFHQLMPEESGSEISKLTLSIRPLMAVPLEEAHRELSDAGIPYLDNEYQGGKDEDLTSSDLNDIGDTSETEYEQDMSSGKSSTELPKDGTESSNGKEERHLSGESQPSSNGDASPTLRQQRTGSGVAQEKESAEQVGSMKGGTYRSNTPGEKRTKKPRPKHKEQWDRRLLSYVRKRAEDDTGTDGGENLSEHNLAVEVVARDAVCAYEKARGRITEQMAQTHPGYDIISNNPLTGEDRFIEVKGVNGEWNQTGVGLSRLQFSNAQDYGDRYWLYVVEFVSDPEHIRVHPIQSPATQVTSFMFDRNWRDATTNEEENPALLFAPGVRISHDDMGVGEIIDVTIKGSTRLLTIKFDGKPHATPNVTLNLYRMKIIETDHGNDAP